MSDQTYLNPVHQHDAADPFVLKYCGEYWCYCSGIEADGRAFGVLHSHDLVNWHRLGGALALLPGNHACYWAPEVTYDNGRFLIYYSVGDGTAMEIRVAIASQPAGPFVDSGRRLTSEPFAIDAHVFTDDDGRRYLFYATDYPNHARVGTGTAFDRLIDPLTLAGDPHPVTRAQYEWQVFDPNRAERGGVKWHTIEGSFVLKRRRRYYQMFSGSNWTNPSYGVSYAIADALDGSQEWRQVANGEQVLPILRTIPGSVIGPGHNSVVRGPDNIQPYCVYHRWAADRSGRQLVIDWLDWAGERMLVVGPSATPQPLPNRPTTSDRFTHELSASRWARMTGEWRAEGVAAVQASTTGVAAMRCTADTACFVAEVSLRALAGAGGYGIALEAADGTSVTALIESAQRRVRVGAVAEYVPLAPQFDPACFHLLRAEVNAGRVALVLDGLPIWRGAAAARTIALHTEDQAAAFAGFDLTTGYEDLFDIDTPALAGWTSAAGVWQVEAQSLRANAAAGEALAFKHVLALGDSEIVVSACFTDTTTNGVYGIFPAATAADPGQLVAVARHGAGLLHLK